MTGVQTCALPIYSISCISLSNRTSFIQNTSYLVLQTDLTTHRFVTTAARHITTTGIPYAPESITTTTTNQQYAIKRLDNTPTLPRPTTKPAPPSTTFKVITTSSGGVKTTSTPSVESSRRKAEYPHVYDTILCRDFSLEGIVGDRGLDSILW